MDLAIEPFLHAADSESETIRLGELMELAQPVIRRVAGAKLSGLTDELEDVCSEARLELLLRLRRLKADSTATPINDFPAYAATIAAHACHRYFRARNPERTRLKNQIRYLLGNEPDFAIREGPRPQCGLAEWNLDKPGGVVPELEVESSRDLAVLIKNIFRKHQRPIGFGVLVDLVSRIWNIPKQQSVGLDEPGSAEIPDRAVGREEDIDQRRYLSRLWSEIRDLPRNQRIALLLHARDGRGYPVLQLVQVTGTAFFPEMASVLGLSELELAELWNQLPLDDNSVAEMLHGTRQQVINLRMAARKRLVNRMRGS